MVFKYDMDYERKKYFNLDLDEDDEEDEYD